ncbi:MAG: heme A synthase [Chloroflexi bacterium]|nr:heme A synthase [Chloroflexota bacterium]
MTSQPFKLFSAFAVAVTFALIVIGGIVRTTGSGLGCPDWPLCYGQAVPPYDIHSQIEFSHRLTTTLVSASVGLMALWATLIYRREKVIVRGAWLAVALLVAQIALGAFVVVYELPPALVGVHLGNALLILATLLAISLSAYRPWEGAPAQSDPALLRLILLSAAAVFALIFSGTVVTGLNAMAACLGWPLCNGDLLPQTGPQAVNLFHRTFAAGVGILLLAVTVRTVRTHKTIASLRKAAHVALGLFGVQVLVGALAVLSTFHPAFNALHLAAAAAVWGGMVALAVVAWRTLR